MLNLYSHLVAAVVRRACAFSEVLSRILRFLLPATAHERHARTQSDGFGHDMSLSEIQKRMSQTVVTFVPWTEYDTTLVFGHPGDALIPSQRWSDAVIETPLMGRLGGPFKVASGECIFGRIADSCLVTMGEGDALTVEARICLLQDDPLFMRLICDLALRLRCRLYVRETRTPILPHPLALEQQLIEVRALVKAPLGLHPGPTFAELRRQASQPN